MQPDNKKIIEALAEAHQELRTAIIFAAQNAATPQMLGCLVDAMRSLDATMSSPQEIYPVRLEPIATTSYTHDELRDELFTRLDSIEKAISAMQEKLGS